MSRAGNPIGAECPAGSHQHYAVTGSARMVGPVALSWCTGTSISETTGTLADLLAILDTAGIITVTA